MAYCDRNDLHLGIGFFPGEPESKKPDLWKGKNLVGEITEQIRDEMLSDPKYADEVAEIAVTK